MSVISPPPPAPPVQHHWRVAGVIVTVVILAVVAFLAFRMIGGSRTSAQQTPQTETSTHEISTLAVNIDAGTLSVLAGPAGQVTITRQLTFKSQPPTYSEVWDGDKLTISSVCPVRSNCEISYTVTVPAATAVNAQLVDGDVSVNGLSGALDLGSKSGSFTLAQTSGSTKISGDSGEVKGTALGSAAVDVQTSAGDVTLAFASAPTTVRVAVLDAGDLKITVPRDTAGGSGSSGYNIDATTRSGDRRVDVTHNATSVRTISVATAAGDIRLTNG